MLCYYHLHRKLSKEFLLICIHQDLLDAESGLKMGQKQGFLNLLENLGIIFFLNLVYKEIL